MSLLKKLQTIPAICKFMINRYASYGEECIKIKKWIWKIIVFV